MNNAIEIKNMNKKVGKFELKDINLELPCGCIMGLIGENGAGKSTLIKTILDLYHKDSGSIAVLGRENTDRFELTKEDIGVVLDDTGIPDALKANELGKIMKHTFKNWDSELYSSYLKKFDIPEKTVFSKLSKGTKMKLAIAIALSHKAKLLIMDEATTGLDPVVRNECLDMFLEYLQDENNTIFMSSHITSDLEKVADSVTFIHKGKLLLTGNKDDILEQHGIIKCKKSDYQEIAPEDIVSCRLTDYNAEVMVRDKRACQSKYAGLIMDNTTLEEIMRYYVNAEKREWC